MEGDDFVPDDVTCFYFCEASSLDQSGRIVCDGPASTPSTMKPETQNLEPRTQSRTNSWSGKILGSGFRELRWFTETSAPTSLGLNPTPSKLDTNHQEEEDDKEFIPDEVGV